jgi:hypothetical protein
MYEDYTMVQNFEKNVDGGLKDPSKRGFINTAKKMLAGYLAVKGIEAI